MCALEGDWERVVSGTGEIERPVSPSRVRCCKVAKLLRDGSCMSPQHVADDHAGGERYRTTEANEC